MARSAAALWEQVHTFAGEEKKREKDGKKRLPAARNPQTRRTVLPEPFGPTINVSGDCVNSIT